MANSERGDKRGEVLCAIQQTLVRNGLHHDAELLGAVIDSMRVPSAARPLEGWRLMPTGYTPLFNAIAAAVRSEGNPTNPIGISVDAFLKALPPEQVAPASASAPHEKGRCRCSAQTEIECQKNCLLVGFG